MSSLLLLLACTGPADVPPDQDDGPATAETADTGDEAQPIVVVTFNSGTTTGLPHDAEPDDGYTSAQAAISDAHYGDGLAWPPAIEAAQAFFATVQPDIVGFQEIFHPEVCPSLPPEALPDFLCATWQPGDPTVVQMLLGPDYQVACHPGKPDKCLAVRKAFGTFDGCDDDLCMEGLDGGTIEGCGSGSRVARGTVLRADGTELTLTHVHGSSGIDADDQDCRLQQIDQVFVDLGDGAPAANGSANVVLGDFNTDPGRWASFDPSAAAWTSYVDGDPFAWVTEAGPDAPLTYQGVATIDHVASDVYAGTCWHPGVTDGEPALLDAVYFDHTPAVCALTPRP